MRSEGRDSIDLLRGGSIVSSLAGSFGSGLRETRLTAMLGYLVALEAPKFCEVFGFTGHPRSVSLETRHDRDRSDILIATTEGVGVVEAKVGSHNAFDQSLKYPADWRVLLTEYIPLTNERSHAASRYLRWRDLTPVLDNLTRSRRPEVRFISGDFKRYLAEHNMIPKAESVEIYAREINEEKTLSLFLHGHMYGCHYEASSRLPEALYFAPHFGKAIALNHPGIHAGISYVAKIETVEVVESFRQLCDTAGQIRGKNWLKKHLAMLETVKNWDWTKRKSFLFLDSPRLVFNPPIYKGNLQEGSGWLSKRVFSFDEFFQAWGC